MRRKQHFAVLYLENDSALWMYKSGASRIDRFKTVSAQSQGIVYKVKKKKVPVNWLMTSGLAWFPALCLSLPTVGIIWVPCATQLRLPHTLNLILPAVNRDFKNSSGLWGHLAPPTLASKPALVWVWSCCLELSRVGIHLSDVLEGMPIITLLVQISNMIFSTGFYIHL